MIESDLYKNDQSVKELSSIKWRIGYACLPLSSSQYLNISAVFGLAVYVHFYYYGSSWESD